MFTGLIEDVGKLAARAARGPGARLTIATRLGPLDPGESISVNGVCLTVDVLTAQGFEADASAETLDKTTLGELAPGARLNLERAMAVGDRLGGHIVSGHVDGTGRLVSREPVGEAEKLVFSFPPELGRFIAQKGSIAVNGISLTVNHVEDDRFDVVIIPRTQKETSLGDVSPGGRVNLEVDLLARYLQRLLQPSPGPQ